MKDIRPQAGDYAEYYGRYVDLVPDGDIVGTLQSQWPETRTLLEGVAPERETFRYAEGKWSLREVVGHCIDVERAFAFRSLWMARAAVGALDSFEQDDWARISNAGDRPLSDLAAEWDGLRASNIDLFRSYDGEAWSRMGMASGFDFRVGAFPWVVAGHELYHRALLRRDYLGEVT